MRVETIVGMLEKPWVGQMSGVAVLVVGSADEGLLARTLARHSAKVVQVVFTEAQYHEAEKLRPQALDLSIRLSDELTSLLISRHFDLIVALNVPDIVAEGVSVVNLNYTDGEYHWVQ